MYQHWQIFFTTIYFVQIINVFCYFSNNKKINIRHKKVKVVSTKNNAKIFEYFQRMDKAIKVTLKYFIMKLSLGKYVHNMS